MKNILLISTALILMTTFANANSSALTTNISLNTNTVSVEVAAPPIKSYGWSKKTIWKNGRSRKSLVAKRMHAYRPGSYLSTKRFKSVKGPGAKARN